MDYSAIVQTISSVGFPIVMCIILFMYVQKITEQYKEELLALREEVSCLRETVSNNTVVMTQVLSKLE